MINNVVLLVILRLESRPHSPLKCRRKKFEASNPMRKTPLLINVNPRIILRHDPTRCTVVLFWTNPSNNPDVSHPADKNKTFDYPKSKTHLTPTPTIKIVRTCDY